MASAVHTANSTSDYTYYTFRSANKMYRSRSHAPKASAGHDRTNTTASPHAVPPLPRSKTPGHKQETSHIPSSSNRENFATNCDARPKATDPLRRSKTPAAGNSGWSSSYTQEHTYAQAKTQSNSPPRVYTYRLYDDEMGPWAQTVNTYTWVMEQEYREKMRRTEQPRTVPTPPTYGPTKEATVETHYFGARSNRKLYEDTTTHNLDSKSDPSKWKEAAHEIDMQARIWMLQEEARRTAALREAEQAKIVQEEVRKIQERIMRKRDMEKLWIMEERRRAQEAAARERERRARARLERAMADAWKVYESRWASIGTASSNEPLSFMSLPWPMLDPPSSLSSLTLARISAFILSNAHSQGHTPRERIKEALRRWHPDRFGRLLQRVVETDRAVVEEGVGIVARCLNEMLSRQGQEQSVSLKPDAKTGRCGTLTPVFSPVVIDVDGYPHFMACRPCARGPVCLYVVQLGFVCSMV